MIGKTSGASMFNIYTFSEIIIGVAKCGEGHK